MFHVVLRGARGFARFKERVVRSQTITAGHDVGRRRFYGSKKVSVEKPLVAQGVLREELQSSSVQPREKAFENARFLQADLSVQV